MMKTAFTAFRFALVGFTLPYMFIYRPALLLMDDGAWQAWMDAETNSPEKAELLSAANAAWPAWTEIAIAVGAAVVGVLALAAGIAGYLRGRLPTQWRVVLFVAAAMLLLPEIYVAGRDIGVWVNLAGAALFALVVIVSPGTDTREVFLDDSA